MSMPIPTIPGANPAVSATNADGVMRLRAARPPILSHPHQRRGLTRTTLRQIMERCIAGVLIDRFLPLAVGRISLIDPWAFPVPRRCPCASCMFPVVRPITSCAMLVGTQGAAASACHLSGACAFRGPAGRRTASRRWPP